MGRLLLTEKYINPTYTDFYGKEVWLDRYGDIVKKNYEEDGYNMHFLGVNGVFIGYQTGISVSTGTYSTAIGTNSVAFGHEAAIISNQINI